MAETLVFKLQPQASYETPIVSVRWYQSDNGINWDTTYIDQATIFSLPSTGINYTFDSILVNADRYHMLKFVDSDGVEAENGMVIPPMPLMIQAEMVGISMSPRVTYCPGDEVNLLFRLNDSVIGVIGDRIKVDLLDEYSTIIDTIYATRVGSLYALSWTIPLNITDQLFAKNHYGFNADFIRISDRWNLIDGSVSFDFEVLRAIEDPADDNCIIHISLTGITDNGTITAKDSVVMFTTKLAPYYATVHDVRSVNINLTEEYDDFTIIKKIINTSRIVDDHMRPAEIFYQGAYDLAVKNYVRLMTAIELVIPTVQMNQEEKKIDTFSYAVNSAMPSSLLGPLNDLARKYALFIWAGGKDTPFVSKTFEKGLYDPGRPNMSRAEFDATGFFPYLNSKTSSYVANIDGNNVEIRGERIVAHRFLLNTFSNYSADTGDVGYLARI
jgi:hypothetical protein